MGRSDPAGGSKGAPVQRHCKHVENLVVLEDRYADGQDWPLQHRASEEIGNVRLTGSDDAIDHVTVGLAGGQFAKVPVSADELPRGGIVETNCQPLDLERLPDLACKAFHVAPLEVGRTRENLERNLDASDLTVDAGKQISCPFPYVALYP
jgi:hypothetical protein